MWKGSDGENEKIEPEDPRCEKWKKKEKKRRLNMASHECVMFPRRGQVNKMVRKEKKELLQKRMVLDGDNFSLFCFISLYISFFFSLQEFFSPIGNKISLPFSAYISILLSLSSLFLSMLLSLHFPLCLHLSEDQSFIFAIKIKLSRIVRIVSMIIFEGR